LKNPAQSSGLHSRVGGAISLAYRFDYKFAGLAYRNYDDCLQISV